jgi:nitronate monooxygenase
MQAPIGSACSVELASAVGRAGGLGSIAMTWERPATVAAHCVSLNNAIPGPWAANFVMAFECPGLPAALEAGAPIITLSWGMPKRIIDLVRRSSSLLGIQVGSSQGAVAAARLGADFLICQGIEAGGHVQSSTPLLTLLREVVALKTGLPLIAAGGIATAEDVRSVLQAGADIAALGTRFVNARESQAHPEYQRAIIDAGEADTAFTCCFDGDWPGTNSRVLRSTTLSRWEADGCPPPGMRPGEGEIIATTATGRDVLRYNMASPVNTTVGRVLDLALYAGAGSGQINDILPAAEIIKRLVAEPANQAVA